MSETGKGQCPGAELCAGCYSLGVIGDAEYLLHPPKTSAQWLKYHADLAKRAKKREAEERKKRK